jgi:ABC-2 type transport system permease protein
MLLSGAEVNWMLMPYIPLLLIELILLALGLAFILSALYVKFRDFAPIWEIILQVLFYATPIIYPLTLAFTASPKIAEILSLNPLAQIMQDLREILITPVTLTTHEVLPPLLSYVLPIAIVLFLVTGGYLYFKSRAKYFVEDL